MKTTTMLLTLMLVSGCGGAVETSWEGAPEYMAPEQDAGTPTAEASAPEPTEDAGVDAGQPAQEDAGMCWPTVVVGESVTPTCLLNGGAERGWTGECTSIAEGGTSSTRVAGDWCCTCTPPSPTHRCTSLGRACVNEPECCDGLACGSDGLCK
jgi:hypothetical protein